MDRRIFLVTVLLAAPAFAGRRSENREQCARIDQRLGDIEAERRAGYTAKRGRKLQAQRQKLEEQRRKSCG
ncbi:hypothetical protein GPROT2_00061 [Gammaproteobacteria bacterium]|nr:MAG: hypothetical protein HRU81_08190 [Gammaproteobacteria bacterium]CAG0937920.1 hypothetical protein GPROT2_00061 [Gammaproteobacteria bacterium]